MINQLSQDIPIASSSLGQVWTPSPIADGMVHFAFHHLQGAPNVILDPCCGPATFEQALIRHGAIDAKVIAFDIDERYANYTKQLSARIAGSEVLCADYLSSELTEQADIVVMNPPYIRHELLPIDKKNQWSAWIYSRTGIKVSKRANLFVYFLLKSLIDLRNGGIMCAIVYDALLNASYGKAAMRELVKHGDILALLPANKAFESALIDAMIVVIRKRSTPITDAGILDDDPVPDGMCHLRDLVKARRGVGMPKRDIYIARPTDLLYEASTPIVVKQQKVSGLILKNADSRAYLAIDHERSDMLSTWLGERLVSAGIPVKNPDRQPIAGPILFNYFVRSRPRHLFNCNNHAASDNFYVGVASGDFSNSAAWLLLNSSKYSQCILNAGRNQGSGLKKLQLFEYKDAIVPDWRNIPESDAEEVSNLALELIDENAAQEVIQKRADSCVKRYLDFKEC